MRLLFMPHGTDPSHPLRTLIETPDELSCVCGYIVMAYIVMAYIIMAYIGMA